MSTDISGALEAVRQACQHPSLVHSFRLPFGARTANREAPKSVAEAFTQLWDHAKLLVLKKELALCTDKVALAAAKAQKQMASNYRHLQQWEETRALLEEALAEQTAVLTHLGIISISYRLS
jgi:hypothetical protein